MNRKEKFYLLFKVGEVNYIFIFGKIGYGKISFMKVFVEVLWEYYISRGQEVFIVIFERKYDYLKFQCLKVFWNKCVEEFGKEEVIRVYLYFVVYFGIFEKYLQFKSQFGFFGDFVMSIFNYIFVEMYVIRKLYLIDVFIWYGL